MLLCAQQNKGFWPVARGWWGAAQLLLRSSCLLKSLRV
jgi:hypothetical protein